MDFRSEAADVTLKKLERVPGTSLADLGESGCVPIPGGRRLHYVVEIPCLILSIACLLAAVSMMPLATLHVLPMKTAFVVLLIGLVISLITRKIRSWLLRLYLRFRAGNLLKQFPGLPVLAVAIEDGQTFQKVKLVVEDEGACLLDAERRRILIEGCSHQYALYAKDVFSIEPVSGYALSGARILCRMADRNLDFVLKTSGQGPLASLGHAFVPSAGASGLATKLNEALFGTAGSSYRQGALPPPLPGGGTW